MTNGYIVSTARAKKVSILQINWHTLRHSVWHNIYIYIDIGSLSGIHCSDLQCAIQAFYPAYILAVYVVCIAAFYLAYILVFFQLCCHSIWRTFWHSMLHMFWGFITDTGIYSGSLTRAANSSRPTDQQQNRSPRTGLETVTAASKLDQRSTDSTDSQRPSEQAATAVAGCLETGHHLENWAGQRHFSRLQPCS